MKHSYVIGTGPIGMIVASYLLENGYKVRMVENLFVNKSVDNENDRKKAEELMLNDKVYKLYKDKSFD